MHAPRPRGLLTRSIRDGSLELQDRARNLVAEGGSAALVVDWRCCGGGGVVLVGFVGAASCPGGGCGVGAGFAVGEAGEEGGFFVGVGGLSGVDGLGGGVVGAVGAGEGHYCVGMYVGGIEPRGVWVLVR
jgi:hypothetical protein